MLQISFFIFLFHYQNSCVIFFVCILRCFSIFSFFICSFSVFFESFLVFVFAEDFYLIWSSSAIGFLPKNSYISQSKSVMFAQIASFFFNNKTKENNLNRSVRVRRVHIAPKITEEENRCVELIKNSSKSWLVFCSLKFSFSLLHFGWKWLLFCGDFWWFFLIFFDFFCWFLRFLYFFLSSSSPKTQLKSFQLFLQCYVVSWSVEKFRYFWKIFSGFVIFFHFFILNFTLFLGFLNVFFSSLVLESFFVFNSYFNSFQKKVVGFFFNEISYSLIFCCVSRA